MHEATHNGHGENRVLVGTPITAEKSYKRYCLVEYLEALGELTYPEFDTLLLLNGEGGDHLPADYPNLTFERIPVRSSAVDTVVAGRNLMRDRVLAGSYEYLLFLEQDIVPPPGMVERLMEHGKPVCSALYFNERKSGGHRYAVDRDRFPMAWFFDQESMVRGQYRETLVPEADLGRGDLLKVDVAGLAAVLIHRSVLASVRFRFDPAQPLVYEEFFFGHDCHAGGIPIFVDCSMVCKHHIARGL